MMANELEELREMVRQLQAEKEHLLKERADAQPEPTSGLPGSNLENVTPGNYVQREQIVYVPRERKCPMFRGSHGIGIDEWTEEVRASMRARYLGPLDQAYFIFDHLDGEAKDEVRFRPRDEREDPERILAILKELYGYSKSYVSLQEDFFSRKQLEGESLQEFSHALSFLMDKVVANAPSRMTNSAVLLRDQFVENVLDSSLRRELKRLVRSNSGLSLLDIRAEAIRWEREGRPNAVTSGYSVPSVCASQNLRTKSQPSGPSNPPAMQISDLAEMLQKQQEQINQLTQGLLKLQAPSQYRKPNSSGVICRRCQKSGHYARDCDNERVPYRPANSVCTSQVAAALPPQQAEN